jgi:hypothetical protein
MSNRAVLDLHARLMARLAMIEQSDGGLVASLRAGAGPTPITTGPGGQIADAGISLTFGKKLTQALPTLDQKIADELYISTVVMRRGRPVITIQQNAFTLPAQLDLAPDIKARVQAAAPVLSPLFPAVGRIDVVNNPLFDWVGTGWLIEPDLIVTNRHVALYFAERDGATFRFLPSGRSVQRASLDFLHEHEREAQDGFRIASIIHVEKHTGPDLAFLRLEQSAARAPLKLAASVSPNSMAAVVGYPARDSRLPDAELMDRLFGGVYNVKRLSPGRVGEIQNGKLLHDCTTLGGSSGSVLLSLESGEALGVHFSGAYLKTNRAVPAPVIVSTLKGLLSPGAKHSSLAPASAAQGGAVASPRANASAAVATGSGGTRIRLNIPVDVVIGLAEIVAGGARAGGSGESGGGRTSRFAPPLGDDVAAALEEAIHAWGGRDDVANIYQGWVFDDQGAITTNPAIVVEVFGDADQDYGLPETIGGVPVDIRPARLETLLGRDLGFGEEEARGWVSNYEPRDDLEGFALDEVNENMELTLHLGPEEGWAHLKPFIAATKRNFVVGMYDFTAPHIVAAVTNSLGASAKMILTLQQYESLDSPAKANDIPDADTVAALDEALGGRFTHAWASVKGPKRLFDRSYHIKVAARDQRQVWLSSGSWQSSNQPDTMTLGLSQADLLRRYNREWHVIANNATLAKLFHTHLEQDRKDAAKRWAEDEEEAPFAQEELLAPLEDLQDPSALDEGSEEGVGAATAFPAETLKGVIRVQPLLSPDNFAEHAVALVKSARKRLLFQNQSLNIPASVADPAFDELVEALLEKQRSLSDVRIILRRIGDIQNTLEKLQSRGFDMSRIRIDDKCHTKGLIVDNKAVMVGSHNWTPGGVSYNRDASLIIFDKRAVAYFEKAFEFDWGRLPLARIKPRKKAIKRVARGGEAADPAGYGRMSFDVWLGET